MKKFAVLFLLYIIAVNSYSQEFRVKSMLELTHDLSARTSPRLDNNGIECALIRINIPTIRDVYFQSPIIGDPIQAPGEYTVYVPTGNNKLQLICDSKPFDIDFSEFNIALQPKSCYRIVITKKIGPSEGTEFAKVNITANYDDDILLIDGVPVGQLPLFLDDLPIGRHTFTVPNTAGRVQNDTVIDVNPGTSMIYLPLRKEKRQAVQMEWEDYYSIGDMPNPDDSEPIWGVKREYIEVKREVRDGKSGLVDDAGNIIIPFRYNNDVFVDCGGYYWVEGDNGKGIFVPGKGEIVPCRYSSWSSYADWGEYWRASDDQGDWLINIKTGKVVCRVHDRGAFKVYNRKYIKDCIESEGKTIIMDIAANRLLTIPYKWYVDFDPIGGFAVAYRLRSGGRYVNLIYDLNGDTTEFWENEYHYRHIKNGLIEVEDRNTGLLGYLDKNLEVVIPAIYRIWDYDYLPYSHPEFALETQDGEKVVFDRRGNVIAQTRRGGINSYKNISFPENQNGLLICEKITGEKGVIDLAKKIIVPFTNDSIESSWRGYFVISKPDGRVQICDKGGNVLLPWGFYKEYEVDLTGEGKGIGLTNEYLMIYEKGQCIVKIPVKKDAEFQYRHMNANGFTKLEVLSGNNLIRRTRDDKLFQICNLITNKRGFLSSMGELITSCIYDDYAESFNSQSSDGVESEYDEELREIYNQTINSWAASEGYGIINVGSRYGFIDTKGEVVVPLIYSAATPFVNGVAYVRDGNGKWTKICSKDLR